MEIIKMMVIAVHNKRTRDSLKEHERAGGGAFLRHRSGDALADCSLEARTAELQVSKEWRSSRTA